MKYYDLTKEPEPTIQDLERELEYVRNEVNSIVDNIYLTNNK